MAGLVEVEQTVAICQLALHFADNTTGVFDISPFVATNTAITAPLRAPDFFPRHYIEPGELHWPCGLNFGAGRRIIG